MPNDANSELKRLQSYLGKGGAYYNLWKGTTREMLAKKGRDMRIRLWQGFKEHAWNLGRKSKRIGFRELKDRTEQGLGTLVRSKIFLPNMADKIPTVDKRGKPLSNWQMLVAQETMRRQAGIGVLAISLLDKRWREGKGGRRLVSNASRKSGKLSEFEQTDDAFIFRGFTPGLQSIADRYGITARAFGNMTADIEIYLKRKDAGFTVRALKQFA